MRFMYRRGPGVRAIWLAAAALQLTLPTAVAWVDAHLEAESRRPSAAAHIESHSTPACAHVHSPDCAFCQFIAHQFASPSSVAYALSLADQVFPAAPSYVQHHRSPLARLPHQRAPPALL
jgi:hypothetical protein